MTAAPFELSRAPQPAGSGRLVIFRLFVIALAIWTGGGVFQTITDHQAWHADPVGWVRQYSPPAGWANPWPLTTGLLGVMTLLALGAFARYSGLGRRYALISIFGAVVILLATGFYFVPRLITIFERTTTLTDAQIIAYSNQWILFNAIRLVALVALLYASLLGLGQMDRDRA